MNIFCFCFFYFVFRLTKTLNDFEVTCENMETFVDDSLSLVPCRSLRTNSMDSDDNLKLMGKNIDEFSKDQPDADTIKMFVGQVPKSWDEIKLRSLFDQYGRVHTLNVLRDKVTMMSRGELKFNLLFIFKKFKGP